MNAIINANMNDIDFVDMNNEIIKLINENQSLRKRNEELEKKMELFDKMMKNIIHEYKKLGDLQNIENNSYDCHYDEMYEYHDDVSISSHSSMPSLVEIHSSDDSYSSMPSLISCSSVRLAMSAELCGNN